jgi:hypothetical protein
LSQALECLQQHCHGLAAARRHHWPAGPTASRPPQAAGQASGCRPSCKVALSRLRAPQPPEIPPPRWPHR